MLTDREKAVLRLIAVGCTSKEVGDALGISVHTVNAHIRSIFRALNVHTRHGAVAIFVKQEMTA